MAISVLTDLVKDRTRIADFGAMTCISDGVNVHNGLDWVVQTVNAR